MTVVTHGAIYSILTGAVSVYRFTGGFMGHVSYHTKPVRYKEPDTRAGQNRARDIVKNLKTTPRMLILPCFPAAHEFFISGRDMGMEGGMKCVMLTVFIAQCSDQNYQCTTK